jgi:hypothetical protein
LQEVTVSPPLSLSIDFFHNESIVMAIPLPFKVSRVAEEHILARLIDKIPRPFELGLTLCFAYESRNPSGGLTEKFHGQHFCIAGDTPEQWASARSAAKGLIAGRTFWIPQDVLRALRGKTLTVRPCAVGYGEHAGIVSDLLVAD